jgi:hypothetical protein
MIRFIAYLEFVYLDHVREDKCFSLLLLHNYTVSIIIVVIIRWYGHFTIVS